MVAWLYSSVGIAYAIILEFGIIGVTALGLIGFADKLVFSKHDFIILILIDSVGLKLTKPG